MSSSSSAPRRQRRFPWPVFWIGWCIAPWLGRWFFIDRIDCRSCVADVVVPALALFGYVFLGGCIYAMSKPAETALNAEELATATRGGYLLGTREDTLRTFFALGLVLAGLMFATAFEWS